MPAATVSSVYPLSPLQEGMLSHQAAGGATAVDLVQIVLNLPEALPAEFAAAWTSLAQRHAILRTAFQWTGSEQRPVQVVAETITPEITREAWTGLASPGQARRWTQLLATD